LRNELNWLVGGVPICAVWTETSKIGAVMSNRRGPNHALLDKKVWYSN